MALFLAIFVSLVPNTQKGQILLFTSTLLLALQSDLILMDAKNGVILTQAFLFSKMYGYILNTAKSFFKLFIVNSS